MSKIKLIFAVSLDGYIGKDNTIPWHIPEDLKRFKDLTFNNVVIMGRKTWDSLPIKPLPDRLNVVLTCLTQEYNYVATGNLHFIENLEVFLRLHKRHEDPRDIWIIGGESIYKAALPFADEIHVTRVDKVVNGDAKAPTSEEIFQQGFHIQPGRVSDWFTSSSGERYRYTVWGRRLPHQSVQ